MQDDALDRAKVIALPPFIYGAALVLGLLIHFVYPVHIVSRRPALWLGIVLILASILIVVSALRALAHAKTTFDVRKATTAIVTDGPYRFSRNPMYLAATLLYLAIGSFINSLWLVLTVIPLLVVIQEGVVKREEQYLERKFGQEYMRYKIQVRRWL